MWVDGFGPNMAGTPLFSFIESGGGYLLKMQNLKEQTFVRQNFIGQTLKEQTFLKQTLDL